MFGFEINCVVYINCWIIKFIDWIVFSLMSKYMYLYNYDCFLIEMSKLVFKEFFLFS